MTPFLIDDKTIGFDYPPFIIAEMSGNHNQSLERALQIVDAAAKAGAHAIKIQTYTADTMTIDRREGAFSISDSGSLWQGASLYELYKKAATPWEWHKPIFDRCKQHGMIGFSTPFDDSAVSFLESLEVPLYKIASFENSDLPLLRKVAATGKPMIVSTGMATISELGETVSTIRESGGNNLVLLKCTSSYPASPENSNVRTIPHMSELFDLPVGLSDHTMGLGAAVAAVALGARVIEKHFTLSRADGGVDSAFSLEPEELRLLVIETRRAWEALGTITYGASGKEKASRQFRRSLYVVSDMKAGDHFTKDNLRGIRPGLGLPTRYFEVFVGKRVNQDVKSGTPLSWDLIG
jgi:N-acetylneuraminate synthase